MWLLRSSRLTLKMSFCKVYLDFLPLRSSLVVIISTHFDASIVGKQQKFNADYFIPSDLFSHSLTHSLVRYFVCYIVSLLLLSEYIHQHQRFGRWIMRF